FHDHGVHHPDLTAHNILLDSSGRTFLVDFDNAKIRAPGPWREAGLARLGRSLREVALETGGEFAERGWRELEAGYRAGEPRRSPLRRALEVGQRRRPALELLVDPQVLLGRLADMRLEQLDPLAGVALRIVARDTFERRQDRHLVARGAGQAAEEIGHDERIADLRELRHRDVRHRRLPEERQQRALVAQIGLIGQVRDDAAALQRLHDPADVVARELLVDITAAAAADQHVHHLVALRVVHAVDAGPCVDEDAEADLERREMRADEQHAAPLGAGPLEMLEAVDADELPQALGRAEPADPHLGERDADRLEVAAAERGALLGRELWKARCEVDLDDPAAAAHQRREHRAERAADRELHRKRQLRDELEPAEDEPRRPVARRAEAAERKLVAGLAWLVMTEGRVGLAWRARAHAGRRTASYTSGYGAGRPLKR